MYPIRWTLRLERKSRTYHFRYALAPWLLIRVSASLLLQGGLGPPLYDFGYSFALETHEAPYLHDGDRALLYPGADTRLRDTQLLSRISNAQEIPLRLIHNPCPSFLGTKIPCNSQG